MNEFIQEEPAWVPRQIVHALHFDQLAQHGGRHGIRDANALEAVLSRPQQRHHYEPGSDLATLAAAYAFGIATAHPFVDGNKRVAYATTLTFLELNGWAILAPEDDQEAVMLGLADGTVTEERLATWLRTHMVPPSELDKDELAG